MRLLKASEVQLDTSGLLCRQSRLRGAAAIALVCGLLAGAPFLWWFLEAPWPVWGGCALLALLIVPFLIHDLLLRLRASSWLLWIRPDGLWINFRSYQQDAAAGDDADSIAHVEYSEIARAERLVETYSAPVGHYRASARFTEESLLIHLNDEDCRSFEAALAAERSRPPVERVVLGFIRVAGKASHSSVTMAAPGAIRVAWRGGHSNDVVPSLETALRRIEQFGVKTEQVQHDHPDWHQLDEAALDRHIRRLIDSGGIIAASRLLVRAKGYSTTEAHHKIEELAGEGERTPRTTFRDPA